MQQNSFDAPTLEVARALRDYLSRACPCLGVSEKIDERWEGDDVVVVSWQGGYALVCGNDNDFFSPGADVITHMGEPLAHGIIDFAGVLGTALETQG